MHLHGISAKELAAQLGLHEKYVSAILNGHREPAGAESNFRAALHRLVEDKSTTPPSP